MLAEPWGSNEDEGQEGELGRCHWDGCDNLMMTIWQGLGRGLWRSPVISQVVHNSDREPSSEVTKTWVQIPLCCLLAL